ncbi:hypothetical protein CEB3_c31480 [Peptococcaceae bacterium CEB3]|nr:hypothetical protein CEB3_c31480 [Peptococcaceae bacterium CEB3]
MASHLQRSTDNFSDTSPIRTEVKMMPWKPWKGAFLQKPSRQEVMMILAVALVSALVIVFYMLRS